MQPEKDDLAPGAYAGSRILPSEVPSPSALAHDGRGMPYQAARLEELAPADREIVAAIGSQAEWMTGFLGKLVAAPTTLGNEEPGQVLVSQALREIGLDPTDVPMEAGAIRAHPGHSPFDWDVSNKRNVVAVWEPAEVDGAGRSLILNGHVDVVSPEPLGQWSQNPFEPRIRDGWLIGRGASDMKCGLAAIVGAVRGLRQLGLSPKAPVTIQSVVEEEITGNGTLQCVLAGHSADAAIVTEPFGAAITTSQVGVLWFRVRITGVAGHAAESSLAVNAIEKSLSMIEALRQLEAELNASAPPPYDRFERPIGLNVGTIAGGDWPSTVPGECVTEYRIAFYPGMSVRDIKDRIEAAVAEAAVNDPAIFAHPPEVEYRGFAAPGYEIPEDHPLVSSLAAAFARHVGNPPALVATTGTTDARILGLYGGVPAVCFGPYAQLGHGVDERAYLPSMVQTAQVLGLFIKDWCGLSG